MARDLVFKVLNRVHHTVIVGTLGRLGWRAGGMPVLELTTTGRRSGRPHTVILTSPMQVAGGHDDSAFVVVASKGGDAHDPAWFHNLVATPNVTVRHKGAAARPMRARVATADERAALWPRVVAAYRGYADYQRRTSREIPLVLLEPTEPS